MSAPTAQPHPGPHTGTSRLVGKPLFLGVCLALICVAWAFVIAPFGGPDEPGHFLRSAALARGQLTGETQENKPDGILYWRTLVRLDPRFDEANSFPLCFRQQSSRPACEYSFVLPPDPSRPATKLVPVDVGLYPPAPYFVTALGTVFGPRVVSMYAARLFNAAASLVLLGFAIAAARRRGGFNALGILLVATPAVFFFASTINPSGLELCAALAAWYLVGDLFSDRARPRYFDLQLAIALSVCALARPLGVMLVGVIVGCNLIASTFTIRQALGRLLQHLVMSSFVAVSVIFSVGWYVLKFSPSTRRSLAGNVVPSTIEQLQIGLGFVPGLLRDVVGNFGWLDTPAPFAAWFPWITGLCAAIVIGVRSAPSRRHQVGALLSLGAAAAVLLSALFQSYTLFHFPALQTRHYLPFAFGAAVLSMGHIPLPSVPMQRLLLWGWAIIQSVCLAHAARRYLYGLATPSGPVVEGTIPWQPMVPIWGAVTVGALSACGIAWHFALAAPAQPQGT